ncbi:MAG TPA: hypothetical protein VM661_12195 [Candidatus Sulfotelmatobacter sp.]|jgi:hypothetical protein|nr:hypothetical protein [Candidatus Sulfotelmatobacter sp.]
MLAVWRSDIRLLSAGATFGKPDKKSGEYPESRTRLFFSDQNAFVFNVLWRHAGLLPLACPVLKIGQGS